MIVLIDMDGVIADFDLAVLKEFRRRNPREQYVPLEDRVNFYVEEDYPGELKQNIQEIYLSKGFYNDLPVIEGSLEALSWMAQNEHDVYICTSPLLSNRYCVSEKYSWVRNNLGSEWEKRVIIAKDKTLIFGDYLIDDKPEVKGIRDPNWEHLLFNQPYNREVGGTQRIDWGNYKEFLN